MLSFILIILKNCLDSTLLSSTQRLYTNVNYNIFLEFCFFQRFTTYFGSVNSGYSNSNAQHGGILYLYELSSKLNIINCIFYNCSCSGSGGAIFYYTSNSLSKCNIEKTCSNNCFNGEGGYGGCFFYLCTPNNQTTNYLSISKCSYNGKGRYSIQFYKGDQYFLNSNSSLNYCYSFSAIIVQLIKQNFISFQQYLELIHQIKLYFKVMHQFQH